MIYIPLRLIQINGTPFSSPRPSPGLYHQGPQLCPGRAKHSPPLPLAPRRVRPNSAEQFVAYIARILIHVDMRDLVCPVLELDHGLQPDSRVVLLVGPACMPPGPRTMGYEHTALERRPA